MNRWILLHINIQFAPGVLNFRSANLYLDVDFSRLKIDSWRSMVKLDVYIIIRGWTAKLRKRMRLGISTIYLSNRVPCFVKLSHSVSLFYPLGNSLQI